MRHSIGLTRLLLPAVAGIALISASVFAGAPDDSVETPFAYTAQTSGDQQLAEQVMSSIRRYSRFAIYDWVSVENSVVTLDGSVREPLYRSDYEKIAARVAGVGRVENRLDVLPLSQFDDDMRLAAARAISNTTALQPLMRQSRPGIHVIVENGRIRLEGVVRTSLDKALAASVVRRQTLALSVVNNLQVENI